MVNYVGNAYMADINPFYGAAGCPGFYDICNGYNPCIQGCIIDWCGINVCPVDICQIPSIPRG